MYPHLQGAKIVNVVVYDMCRHTGLYVSCSSLQNIELIKQCFDQKIQWEVTKEETKNRNMIAGKWNVIADLVRDSGVIANFDDSDISNIWIGTFQSRVSTLWKFGHLNFLEKI